MNNTLRRIDDVTIQLSERFIDNIHLVSRCRLVDYGNRIISDWIGYLVSDEQPDYRVVQAPNPIKALSDSLILDDNNCIYYTYNNGESMALARQFDYKIVDFYSIPSRLYTLDKAGILRIYTDPTEGVFTNLDHKFINECPYNYQFKRFITYQYHDHSTHHRSLTCVEGADGKMIRLARSKGESAMGGIEFPYQLINVEEVEAIIRKEKFTKPARSAIS